MTNHTNRVLDFQPPLTTIEATVLLNILEGNRHGFMCFPSQIANLRTYGLLDKELTVTPRGSMVARLFVAQKRAECEGRKLGFSQCA